MTRAYGAAEVADGRIALADDQIEKATTDLKAARALVGAGKEARLRGLQAETSVNAVNAEREVAVANRIAAYAQLALASAFILSVTFVPAMIALLISGKITETEVRPIRWFKARYAPGLARVVARPLPFVVGGVATFALAAVLFTTLGKELMPTLDEKHITLTVIRILSTSVEQSKDMQL